MYVCILNQEGAIVFHRNLPSAPDAFLKALAAYREDLVVASRTGPVAIVMEDRLPLIAPRDHVAEKAPENSTRGLRAMDITREGRGH